MLLSGIAFVFMLNANYVNGIDPFETFLVLRFNCYKKIQDGCTTNFIDKHTDLAWSNDNLTKAETWFFLFTNNNTDEPELLHKCADQPGYVPPNSHFNRECKTEIILPGYVCGVCPFAILRELKNERLKSGCYNVILVDWSWGNGPDMVEAKENVKIAAKQIAILIKKLIEKFGVSPNDFILTGHSFGAHMAGLVGQYILQDIGERIGVINGLDPAGVVYSEKTPLDERLDKGDASCVQVLHTNAGQCLPGAFGVNFTCGHTDVWYNDGVHQDSAYPYIFTSFLKLDFFHALYSLYFPAGWHMMAWEYYKASINPTDEQFTGVVCRSKTPSRKYKCDDCGKNGKKCATVGAYRCNCTTTKKHTNIYVKTSLLCPWIDNTGLNTTAVTCGTKPPQC